MGLPLAKKTIDSLGGELKVESEPEQGTQIRIQLPTTGMAIWTYTLYFAQSIPRIARITTQTYDSFDVAPEGR